MIGSVKKALVNEFWMAFACGFCLLALLGFAYYFNKTDHEAKPAVKYGEQMAPDGSLIEPWVSSGTPRRIEPALTCYPPTYLWGARAEHIPMELSGVATEPMGSGWHHLSFSLWVRGDVERAARWYTKLIAVGTSEARLDELLDLEQLDPPVCEMPVHLRETDGSAWVIGDPD